ncbi:glycosyltransferase involved in cell wall biosynthesis [Rhodoblastus acidophilus]|uniref:glycosyl transferase n=1 Tax=Rhodoblastus acidophilus TaxID=1074 RepID=UPI0022240FBD|nr:glycosyl transferase [Rhodoblastus acidophilus]MCW2282431.1 glycosyltransferase involved in cell wall biosynthesis [Rhodoblastus acidophilus]MCW2331164.1 glycosyltransferase involved in cell wall biosynthesis [Rhodoblastus acidophilus]
MTPWGEEDIADHQCLFGRTILQLIPALEPGPEAFACIETAAALDEAGARALVAGGEGPLVSELQARGGVFLPFDLAARNPITASMNRSRLAVLAEREGVELIHLRGEAGFAAALHAARRLRIPLVAEDFGPAALEADTIVVHSRQALEAAEAEWPHLAQRFVRGLRGVDLHASLSQPMDPARVKKLREGWGVRPHERVVVGLGLPSDRQKFFLLAAAQLAKRNFLDNEAQEVRFVWRDAEGADLSSGPFEAEARQLGLDRHVLRVAGGDPAAACLAAALVATPAGDARLSVEAQALGAPTAVLQSAADQYVETVLTPPQVDPARRTGWIIAPDQPSAFARAAEEALRLGASAREALALRGAEHARAFSAERMSALTLSTYARHFRV